MRFHTEGRDWKGLRGAECPYTSFWAFGLLQAFSSLVASRHISFRSGLSICWSLHATCRFIPGLRCSLVALHCVDKYFTIFFQLALMHAPSRHSGGDHVLQKKKKLNIVLRNYFIRDEQGRCTRENTAWICTQILFRNNFIQDEKGWRTRENTPVPLNLVSLMLLSTPQHARKPR